MCSIVCNVGMLSGLVSEYRTTELLPTDARACDPLAEVTVIAAAGRRSTTIIAQEGLLSRRETKHKISPW
jgi:hypothetical protein